MTKLLVQVMINEDFVLLLIPSLTLTKRSMIQT